MTAPLYVDRKRPRSAPQGCNLGLWYTRFFNDYDRVWQLDENAKRRWIDNAVRFEYRPKDQALAKTYAHRRIDLVRSHGGALRELKTRWHFATGLGLPHPVENGFTWHHTLGLPFLPATSVKGLLAAWLYLLEHDEDETGERQHEAARRRRHWCGIQDGAGALVFFDALPTSPPELIADVMTPHMGQWYAKGGTIRDTDRDPEKVPADWHSPIPVPFLVVQRATFLFGIAPRLGADWQGLDPKIEVEAALEELENALDALGAGAKTAVGYGRFKPGRSILAERLEAEEEEARNRSRARARAAKLARFDGFDPPVTQIIGAANLDGLATKVLQAMETGTWPTEQCRDLAGRLKAWLVERGEWVEDAASKADKAGKDKKIKRALKIMKWLA